MLDTHAIRATHFVDECASSPRLVTPKLGGGVGDGGGCPSDARCDYLFSSASASETIFVISAMVRSVRIFFVFGFSVFLSSRMPR